MGGQWSIWEALAEKATQNSLGNSVRHLWGYLAARFAGTFAGTLLGQRGRKMLTGHCTGSKGEGGCIFPLLRLPIFADSSLWAIGHYKSHVGCAFTPEGHMGYSDRP